MTWQEWLEAFRACFPSQEAYERAYQDYPCERAHEIGIPPLAAFYDWEDHLAIASRPTAC